MGMRRPDVQFRLLIPACSHRESGNTQSSSRLAMAAGAGRYGDGIYIAMIFVHEGQREDKRC